MRLDRCLAALVGTVLVVSTLLLIHGIWLISSRNAVSSVTSGSESDESNHKIPRHVSSNKNLPKPPKKSSQNTEDGNNNNNNNHGFFWGGKKSDPGKKIGWNLGAEEISRSCSSEYFDSLPTYDDYIAGGVSREERRKILFDHQQQHSDGSSSNQNAPSIVGTPCDPFTVPFASSFDSSSNSTMNLQEKQCLKYMKNPKNWEIVRLIEPKFEQRTVKYVVTLKNQNATSSSSSSSSSFLPTRLLMKVPQQSFATEPFAEITAFAMDRALNVNRIPPTVLVPFPIKLLRESAYDIMSTFKMVMELGYREDNFTKWWESEFYGFVRRTTFPEVMPDEEHVWVSLQVMVEGVVPLLESPAKVPYTKKMSGWHRWFNPKWEGFAAVTNTTPVENPDPLQSGYEAHSTKPYQELLHASMMALSELSIFDFILLNNDRSPNKNNFVSEGCFSKRKFVAIESNGGGAEKEDDEDDRGDGKEDNNNNKHHKNNDDEKEKEIAGNKNNIKKNLKMKKRKAKDFFCSAEQIKSAKLSEGGRRRATLGHALSFVHLDQGMSFHGFSHVNNPIAKKVNNTFCMFYRPMMEKVRCFLIDNPTPEVAEKNLKRTIPKVAEKALGQKRIRWMIGQLTALMQKKNECVERFGEDIALQPMRFPV